MNTSIAQDVRYIQRPEGRIAYTVEGNGPLIVAVPGMGDLRSTFRELVGPLVAAGYRVAVMDLRGHGDSDTTFHEHGDIVTAHDLIALIDELGGPAVVLGNSMGAAAATWAAAERPDAIAGLALYGPLLRDPAMSAFTVAAVHGMYRVLLVKPWGVAFWATYYKGINKGTKAPWLDEHIADIRTNMKEPGRLRSFRELSLQLTHRDVERRLPEVHVPILAYLGDSDPDYKDPSAERDWLESAGAEAILVREAGHYPQSQHPEICVPGTLAFIDGIRERAVVSGGGAAAGESAVATAWASRA